MTGSTWAAVFAAMAALALTGCAAAGTAAPSETVESIADYLYYPTVADLVDTADLVVTGTVEASRPDLLWPDPPGSGVGPEETDPELNPLAGVEVTDPVEASPFVVTVHTLRVTEVIKGEAVVGGTVEVRQMGGVLDGVAHRFAGDEPLVAGPEYLLAMATYPDASASLLSPGQAVHTVGDDGALTPWNGSPPVFDGTVAVTVADFRDAAS